MATKVTTLSSWTSEAVHNGKRYVFATSDLKGMRKLIRKRHERNGETRLRQAYVDAQAVSELIRLGYDG